MNLFENQKMNGYVVLYNQKMIDGVFNSYQEALDYIELNVAKISQDKYDIYKRVNSPNE